MMPECRFKFSCSSVRVPRLNTIPLTIVDGVAIDYTKVQTECSDEYQDIDVVNMLIQCHRCGGWGHHMFQCQTVGQ